MDVWTYSIVMSLQYIAFSLVRNHVHCRTVHINRPISMVICPAKKNRIDQNKILSRVAVVATVVDFSIIIVFYFTFCILVCVYVFVYNLFFFDYYYILCTVSLLCMVVSLFRHVKNYLNFRLLFYSEISWQVEFLSIHMI